VAVCTTVCPHCGLNIRSGESYDAKVRRVKARDIRVERLGAPLLLGLAFMLGLIMLGGYLYQKRAETVIREKQAEFGNYIWRLETIDSLAAAGRIEEAREAAEKLARELKARQAQIKIEAAPTSVQRRDPRRRPKPIRAAEKSLLGNLAKKAEFKVRVLSARSR